MSKSVQLLVFCIGDQYCGLYLAQVDRVIRAVDITPLPEAPDVVLGVIDLHGILVPLMNVRKRFGFADRPISVDDHFIIARCDERTMGLAVDTVKGIVERSPEAIIPPEKILHKWQPIEGVIQLEDGLVLIRDLDQFLSLDEDRVLEQALTAESHGK